MFKNPQCYWHELHYFVSQIYYGEDLGIKVAAKLMEHSTSLSHKTSLENMRQDEILHSELFEDFIISTFGSVFPKSQGIEKVIRLCLESDNPRLVATVAHGVLEPCSMVVLKGLRAFVKDRTFQIFTDKVMRDEANHIRLVPSDAGMYPKSSEAEFEMIRKSAINAFRAMASIGKGKLLMRRLDELGVDMEDEQPYESAMYLRKNEMSIKVVRSQLKKLGIDILG
jgi:hypothetical protein